MIALHLPPHSHAEQRHRRMARLAHDVASDDDASSDAGDSGQMKSTNNHVLPLRGGGELVCLFPGCGRTFTLKRNLKRHIRLHTEEKEHECSMPGCGKRFARRSDLRLHEQRHGGLRRYPCLLPACPAEFLSRAELAEHEVAHLAVLVPQRTCAVCGGVFDDLPALSVHLAAEHPHYSAASKSAHEAIRRPGPWPPAPSRLVPSSAPTMFPYSPFPPTSASVPRPPALQLYANAPKYTTLPMPASRTPTRQHGPPPLFALFASTSTGPAIKPEARHAPPPPHAVQTPKPPHLVADPASLYRNPAAAQPDSSTSTMSALLVSPTAATAPSLEPQPTATTSMAASVAQPAPMFMPVFAPPGSAGEPGSMFTSPMMTAMAQMLAMQATMLMSMQLGFTAPPTSTTTSAAAACQLPGNPFLPIAPVASSSGLSGRLWEVDVGSNTTPERTDAAAADILSSFIRPRAKPVTSQHIVDADVTPALVREALRNSVVLWHRAQPGNAAAPECTFYQANDGPAPPQVDDGPHVHTAGCGHPIVLHAVWRRTAVHELTLPCRAMRTTWSWMGASPTNRQTGRAHTASTWTSSP